MGQTVLDREELLDELQRGFDKRTAEILVGVLEKAAARMRQPWEEYAELRAVVADLAQETKGLAAAQRRTEEAVAKWAERTGRLEEAMANLAERTGRLEEAMANLAERTGRLEVAVERLASAQERTEAAVANLARQVGGLSETVGGDIEDIGYIVIHDVLAREFGWKVSPLERSWQTWDSTPEEVDLFGSATDPGDPGRQIWIVGEAKHNLTLKEVQRFEGQVRRARAHLEGEVFAVCFCYRARPEVQQAVRDAGIRMVFSYGKLA